MRSPTPSLAGLRLLDRRNFLAHLGTGLGGVALLSLLAERAAAEERTPWRPAIRPEAPLAARPPHFPAKAKRVLHIFCSGACSHLDTWDYKPELIKRHGQPMPGGENLVTFQGANGALTKSPYAFRPRGKSGKYVSDLLPNLAGDPARRRGTSGRSGTTGRAARRGGRAPCGTRTPRSPSCARPRRGR